MPTPATNPDVPSNWAKPGIYISINLSGGGASANDNGRRVLILAYRSSSGADAPDTPTLYNQQSAVNDGHGRGSDAARAYAAHIAQVGPGKTDVYVCGVAEPSGGTAATYTLTFAGPATEPGTIDVYVCGYRASVGIANGDTAATVATALYNQLALLLDLPCTFADDSAGTLTATYRHKGLLGNDLPIQVDQTDASGITISPGKVTLTGNPSGNGTISLVVGATTIASAIDSTVQTTAILAGTKLAADINAGAYPVTAVDNGDASVTLIYRKGRVVRRISVSDTVATTTSAVSLHGTSGAGVPTLTSAISNIAALSYGFNAWINCFNDASGTTSLDSIYDHVITATNGLNQKPAMVFTGSVDKLTTAGAVVTAPAPDLTASPRFSVPWCREAPQQAYEMAARTAGAYLAPVYVAQNLDGAVLATSGGVPLGNPPIADRPQDVDLNSAVNTYYLCPIIVDGRDQLTIMTGRTTSNDSNQDLRELSCIRQLDAARASLNERLATLFSGKSYRTSTPRTPNTIAPRSVKDAAYVWAREKDDQDLFDDAAAWKDAISCAPNAVTRTRLDLYVPLALIRPLHILATVLDPK